MARKRRSKGEGSIFFHEKKGLWVSKITLPDGSSKFQYAKTQREVRDKHLTTINQLREGMLPKDDSITVSEYMAHYMETIGKQTLRPRTQEINESFLRVHILPSLGKIKLKDLRADHLQGFYTQKISQGLSKRTVQMMHTLLRTTLKQAMRWGFVPRNVTDLVQAPRPVKKAPTFFTKEQLTTFLESVRGHRWYLIYLLLVYGGFREGEVLGIHFEDCDMTNRVINVRHTVITLKSGVVIGEPKTKSSKRAVTLPKIAYDELKIHLEQLERKQGLIFTTSTGSPISPRNFIRHFKKALHDAGLPDIRVHDLRHSHASLLLASGVNPKLVQERLGHASIALTLDTYSHVIPSLQEEVAKKMDDLMG
jgi:integrase